MTLTEFEKLVTSDESLDLVGIMDLQSGNPKIVVKHKPTQVKTQIPVAYLDKLALEDARLMPILRAEQEPNILIHMTRIVGYFSRSSNWNPSKIGELKDRRKGSYSIAEATA